MRDRFRRLRRELRAAFVARAANMRGPLARLTLQALQRADRHASPRLAIACGMAPPDVRVSGRRTGE